MIVLLARNCTGMVWSTTITVATIEHYNIGTIAFLGLLFPFNAASRSTRKKLQTGHVPHQCIEHLTAVGD